MNKINTRSCGCIGDRCNGHEISGDRASYFDGANGNPRAMGRQECGAPAFSRRCPPAGNPASASRREWIQFGYSAGPQEVGDRRRAMSIWTQRSGSAIFSAEVIGSQSSPAVVGGGTGDGPERATYVHTGGHGGEILAPYQPRRCTYQQYKKDCDTASQKAADICRNIGCTGAIGWCLQDKYGCFSGWRGECTGCPVQAGPR